MYLNARNDERTGKCMFGKENNNDFIGFLKISMKKVNTDTEILILLEILT